jgi:hypothetical protein
LWFAKKLASPVFPLLLFFIMDHLLSPQVYATSANYDKFRASTVGEDLRKCKNIHK